MKFIRIILFIHIGLVGGLRGELSSFSDLEKSFESPPIEYSTAPFWVWNDVVTKEKIDRDLEAYCKRGIFQVMVHPRPGLITEYLSNEWFELFDYTLMRAKELGMKVWIYDENSFPSGFGGGHVGDVMPESVTQKTTLIMESISPERGDSDLDAYDFVVKHRSATEVLKSSNESSALSFHEPERQLGFHLLQDIPNGWFGGKAYVDLLLEGVTETFINVTMSGYEKIAGKDFGERIPGVFTDEPNIRPRGAKNGIRWTQSLEEDFYSRWGYELLPHLPSLFEEVGDWKKVRHNYYSLLLELFIQRWSQPWFEYTEQHELEWTGHYWEHGWPNPAHGGDNMAMYAWHQTPGIDMLFNNRTLQPDQFGNIRAVKELSSVCNQLGRHRALSESYGAAGWGLNFDDMKRLGDWQYVLGVNLMCQHLTYMTLKGRRKGDFPQSISYHAPYWDEYGVLASYFHRLSFALTRGEQQNRILVLEPTTSSWMYFSPTQLHAMLDQTKATFHSLLAHFESQQVEYDLACENILQKHGRIEDGRFCVGLRNYELLIIPEGMDNVDRNTFELIEKFLASGGQILRLGRAKLERIDGSKTDVVEELFVTYENQIETVLDPSRGFDFKTLGAAYNGCTPIEPEESGGELFHMRRQLKDGQLLFLSNFSKDEVSAGSFKCDGCYVNQLDAMSGEIETYPFELTNNRVSFDFELPPSGSLLLFIHDQTESVVDRSLNAKRPKGEWVSLKSPTVVSRQSLNSIALDYLNLDVGGQSYESVFFNTASNEAFRLSGLETYGREGYNPWAVAVQHKRNILDLGKRFAADSGFDAQYNFWIISDDIPSELKAVVEWGELYEISINGHRVHPKSGDWWLDETFTAIDIASFARKGKNVIRLHCEPMNIHAEIEPVFVVGNFSAKQDKQGFSITSSEQIGIGPWKDHGLPMYSGRVSYSKTILNRGGLEYRVRLNEWNGTVASVKVNGIKVGIIASEPHELNITQWLNNGVNSVTIEVVGSLQNLLGPHHNNPQKGFVTPWSWFSAPDVQPAGADYELLEYGLFEDFDVLECNTDSHPL